MPTEVALLFDYGGVLTSAAVPAARRLAEIHMHLVFVRASAHVSFNSCSVVDVTQTPTTLSHRYSNIYLMVSQFTNKVVGRPSAWVRLETGNIRRNAFIELYHKELEVFLDAMRTGGPVSPVQAAPNATNATSKKEEDHESVQAKLTALGILRPQMVADWRRKYPHLTHAAVQTEMLRILDAESLLCVLEKLALRKNVLNMLHYLRVKTAQDIKIGIVTNNWEAEGHFVRNADAVSQSGSPIFISANCPLEYEPQHGHHTVTFDVNGLFDVVVQSYMIGKAKPGPDIYNLAVESVLGKYRTRDEKAMVFFFDDLRANCDAASKLASQPFSGVYHISNGAVDVYRGVLAALQSVAKKDPYWAKIVKGFEADIGPLFTTAVPATGTTGGSTPVSSWVQREFDNIDKNLLPVPLPPNNSLVPMTDTLGANYIDLDARNRILFYLARALPQHFMFNVTGDSATESGNLCEDSSFATSSGPCVFEMFRGGMSNPTYRITCRTGSFVLRKQPQGKILPGAHNVQREYDICQFLAKNSKVPVPKVLVYCQDRKVCVEDFYVMRYRDGRMIRNVAELSSAPFTRPFSQSRVLVKTTLNPQLFYREAIKALVALHGAPVPSFLKSKRQAAELRHPILHIINTWQKQYDRTLLLASANEEKKTEETGKTMLENEEDKKTVNLLKCNAFEFLCEAIRMQFSHSDIGAIPFPEKMCLCHGDFKLDNIMFSHRSLEGRAKYPPKILMLLDFELTHLGDPLTDVAYLALYHYFPSPRGVSDLDRRRREMYPSAHDLFEYYCTKSVYFANVPTERRKKIFDLYMAAMCYKLAGIAHGVVARGLAGNATDPSSALQLMPAVEHLSVVGCELLGVTPSPPSKL